MGIEADFDISAIEQMLRDKRSKLDFLVMRRLNYLGMQCVNIARELDTYTDRTANLRNSIGYIIAVDGNIKGSNFERSAVGTEESELDGLEIGQRVAKELALEFPIGYALIVVAGMNYASYVEDIHHLPVLQPAKNFAQNEAEKIISDIMRKMES